MDLTSKVTQPAPVSQPIVGVALQAVGEHGM
jgi:hypothetical protein